MKGKTYDNIYINLNLSLNVYRAALDIWMVSVSIMSILYLVIWGWGVE